mmetsp:Transcript_22755/g.52248  ORF Transcript_22755/g.52248 Transcript_22755/m.52248 type:complete len:381 (-) Transcript_22755:247-1389(-)
MVVRQHLADLAEVAGRDASLVVEAGNLGPEVVVAIVATPAGVEVDVHLGDLADHAALGVVGDLPIFGDVHLGAVGSSDQGHLLHAATHGHAGDLLDVAALVHVIVHRDEEEVVPLVARVGVVLVRGPRQSVAVDCSLAGVVVLGEAHEALAGVEGGALVALVQVREAEVGVVGRVLVDAVLVVGLRAVPVPVVRLAVLGPAAHCRVRRAGGVASGVRHGALEVGQLARPRDASALRGSVVERPDELGVALQDRRGRLVVRLVDRLDLLLPVAAAVEEHLFEVHVGALLGCVRERDLLRRIIDLVADLLGGGPRGVELGLEVLFGRGGAVAGDGAGGAVDLVLVGLEERLAAAFALELETEWACEARLRDRGVEAQCQNGG